MIPTSLDLSLLGPTWPEHPPGHTWHDEMLKYCMVICNKNNNIIINNKLQLELFRHFG